MGKPLVLDLFSGAGGFTLGALAAGFDVAGSVDVDSDLVSCHSDNFPGIQVVIADLLEVTPREVLAACRHEKDEILGVIGGPPCQGFSQIGRRDLADPRNRLLGRFFDYVRDIGPPFFVLENVPGILDGRFEAVLADGLSKLGTQYAIVGPVLLDAERFGAPTLRRRVMIFGFRTTKPVSFDPAAGETSSLRTVRDAIWDLPSPGTGAREDDDGQYWDEYPDCDHPLSGYASRMRQEPPDGLASPKVRKAHSLGLVSGLQPTVHSAAVRQRFSEVSPGRREPISKFPRLQWEAPAPTLRAGTGRDRGSFQAVRPIHPCDDRVISIREAARIQGFPDWFQFHRAKWHSFRMIGNSVSPLMAAGVLRRIRQIVKELA